MMVRAQSSGFSGKARCRHLIERRALVGKVLTVMLGVAGLLAVSGCAPGPPATFTTSYGNGYRRAA